MGNKYSVDDVLKVLPELPYPEWRWEISYDESNSMTDEKYILNLYMDYGIDRAFSKELPLKYGIMTFSGLQKTAQDTLETALMATLNPANIIPCNLLWKLAGI